MRKKKTAVSFYPAIDEIDDIDAKQYRQASFSTRNSALNTSLRKPIRMQDFIQLCDSNYKLHVASMLLVYLGIFDGNLTSFLSSSLILLDLA